jgi:hypothetical protein
LYRQEYHPSQTLYLFETYMVKQRYEFNVLQNEIVNGLAVRLIIVGAVLIVVGIILLWTLFIRTGSLVGLLEGGLNLITGLISVYAGQAFRRIVQTKGDDIDNLIEALKTMTMVYNVEIATLIITGIGLAYNALH